MDPRAALYHRVSTVDQNPDAARYGFAVALDIEETSSGANNQRPGLVQVLTAAQRGEIEAVIVWKLDRFGRSALDLLTNLRQLDAAGRPGAPAQGKGLDVGGDRGAAEVPGLGRKKGRKRRALKTLRSPRDVWFGAYRFRDRP